MEKERITSRQRLNDFIVDFSIGKVQHFLNMAVAPFTFKQANHLEYLLATEAYARDLLRIEEISQSGSVPRLVAINRGDLPILLLEGDLLKGGKQHRVVNTSILLAPRSKTTIPVSCVEQGRWGFSRPDFEATPEKPPVDLRSKMQESVSRAFKSSGRPQADQGEIWAEVTQALHFLKAETPTMSLSGYSKRMPPPEKGRVEEYMNAFQYAEGQNGFLVFLEGKIKGIEMWEKPQALEKNYEELIRSYAVSALRQRLQTEMVGEETASPSRAEFDVPDRLKAQRTLEHVLQLEGEPYDGIGLGHDLRFEGIVNDTPITGHALEYQSVVLHATFFAKNAPNDRKGGRRGFPRPPFPRPWDSSELGPILDCFGPFF